MSRYAPGMRRMLSLGTVAVVLAVAASTAGAANQPRWIVFSASSTGHINAQLYRIQTSGQGLKQLTTGSYPSFAPNFSPDGKRIVFARTGVGILSVNLDGTGLRRLTKNARDSFPTFSPDGKQIAFVRAFKDGWKLHVMSSSGAAEHALPKAPPSGRPTWTVDGIMIPSGGDYLKVDPKTGHVLKYYGVNIDAVWGMNTVALSPGRTSIAFVGGRSAIAGDLDCGDGPCQRFALYRANILKNKKVQKVVNDAGPATFSHDGKQLAFVFNNELVLWSLATGKRTSISTGDAYPTITAPPAWQP
jgi:hypothetical protein